MDVGAWLRANGFARFETAFRDNEIDSEVLRELTEGDLEKLGLPLGPRKRMLKAIAALGDPLEPGHIVANPSTERRQITVLFCDLVGSTGLSGRLDPEDMRSVIAAYHRLCKSLVERHGGFVAEYLGDGLLVYFGYPSAHEDNAERAASVGLTLVEGVPKLETVAGVPLRVRVGIATGVVVVGDLVGEGDVRKRAAVGDTPNLAARLQGLAQPGEVVICETTRRLVGELFKLAELGPQVLKGLPGSTNAYAVLHARAVESRFEAFQGTAAKALVGREGELETLLRRWSHAKAGEGQVVLLSGEAGIGKSRLTAALMDGIADEPHLRLRYLCSPQHADSALFPVIGQLQRAAEFSEDDNATTKLAKLDALLGRTPTSREDAALLADLLSLSNDGRYPALEYDAQSRRQKTFEALLRLTTAMARQVPVLVVLEDAHWADPTSLELFGRMVDLAVRHRLLVVVTFRPEFCSHWTGQSHATAVTLNRLARGEIDRLIEGVVGDRLLPTRIREDIIERTDGVPLFVEEMTKAVLEAEVEGEAQRVVTGAPTPVVTVPASLQASLLARLDRLGPAREIAQTGAAIGRQFSHAMVAAIANKSESELVFAIDRLTATGLLLREGAPPHANYLFKHALVQDAAYSTLLREPRRALHARIAEVLESQFPETADSQPELLARHYGSAGLIEKSARLWGKAGLRSQERSALVEASEQLGYALAQIAELPSTPDLRREQIALQVALMNTLMHVKGYATAETRAAVERAQQLISQGEMLGETPDDVLAPFSTLYGDWIANFMAFSGDIVKDIATQFLALAESQKTSVPLMIGHRIMGSTLLFLGDIAGSIPHYDRALTLYRPSEHRQLTGRFGADTRTTCLCWRSHALWLLGYADAARADADSALTEAREIGEAATLMFVIDLNFHVYMWCGDYDAAITLANELFDLAEQKGSAYRKVNAMIQRSYILSLTGNVATALEMMTSGRALSRSMGSTLFMPESLHILATAHAALNQFDDSWSCIERALATMMKTKEQLWEAEVNRVAGEIAVKQHNLSEAWGFYDRSLAVARAQRAKSWELRTSTSMARLLCDQGRRVAARDLLGPICDWFTEGLDTLDLKKAKELLTELTS